MQTCTTVLFLVMTGKSFRAVLLNLLSFHSKGPGILRKKRAFKSNDLKALYNLVGTTGQISIALCKVREVGI
jgi:hypothetical protein